MSDTPFFDEQNEEKGTFPDELELVVEPDKTPQPKVIAATAGSAVGGAAALILAWILGMMGVEMPTEVQGAVSILLVAVFTFVAGYWKKN